MKEKGNSCFKERKFENALEMYGYAETILARFQFEDEIDRIEFCELAICILEVKDFINRKKAKDQIQNDCPKGLGLGLPQSTKKFKDELKTELSVNQNNHQEKKLIKFENKSGDDNVEDMGNVVDKESFSEKEDGLSNVGSVSERGSSASEDSSIMLREKATVDIRKEVTLLPAQRSYFVFSANPKPKTRKRRFDAANHSSSKHHVKSIKRRKLPTYDSSLSPNTTSVCRFVYNLKRKGTHPPVGFNHDPRKKLTTHAYSCSSVGRPPPIIDEMAAARAAVKLGSEVMAAVAALRVSANRCVCWKGAEAEIVAMLDEQGSMVLAKKLGFISPSPLGIDPERSMLAAAEVVEAIAMAAGGSGWL
ncbi:Origin recognition complex subunit 1 [Bienertia sinuspersici]